MKAINTGNTYQLYDNSVQTFDALPAQVYKIVFNPMRGFWLEKANDLEINEKIYGVHQKKVDKVYRSFVAFERNLGVILSGSKGIGKSLFAKMLGIKAIENGYPLILVDAFIPGLADFINSIEQEVVVIFDEFDKTFASRGRNSEHEDPQAEMLTLFDGFSTGKKMFIVTCNSLHELNSFLVNRPGRFHYHFRFDYPGDAEIQEYMSDKLPPAIYEKEIGNICSFSKKVSLNYDCLRAIAFELNNGAATFKEAIEDLNIVNLSAETYDLYLYFEDGSYAVSKEVRLDLFSNEEESIDFDYKGRYDFLTVEFVPNTNIYDYHSGGCIIPGDQIDNFHYDCMDSEEVDEDWGPKFKQVWMEMRNAKISHLLIKKNFGRNIHYAV